MAVGKGSTPTPKGTFRIINKQLNPGGPYGARWMGLNSPGEEFMVLIILLPMVVLFPMVVLGCLIKM